MSLRLVFMGTPAFAVPALLELVGAGHEVAAVHTRAPAPAGRGLAPRPSPVQAEAERLGLPVLTPATLKGPDGGERDGGEAAAAALRALGADLVVVVAYGLLLPVPVLEAPPLGCLNLHGSLLPRWRGAAPVQRAIMVGDAVTGVCAMRMEAGLDTGPVGLEERVSIGPDETAGELAERLSRLGADLLVRAVGAMERGSLSFRPQPEEGVTHAAKITKAEARLDWSRPAREVHDRARGLSPFPGAWFEADLGRGPERVKALRTTLADGAGPPGTVLDDALTVACGAGAVRLVQLQRAGGGPLDAAAFRRGARLAPGARLA